jgi:hypothetical protein
VEEPTVHNPDGGWSDVPYLDRDDPDQPEYPKGSWAETLHNIPAVEQTMPDLGAQSLGLPETAAGSGHRRSGGIPPALIGIGLAGLTAAVLGLGFYLGFASTSKEARPAPTVTETSVMPGPTVTRPGRTRVLPGTTHTRDLRARVTVRSTVTATDTRPPTACPEGSSGKPPFCTPSPETAP